MTFTIPVDESNYIRKTNLSSYMIHLCILADAGYDTLTNLKELDTPEFLDLLEYHQIKSAIESHEMRQANGNRN